MNDPAAARRPRVWPGPVELDEVASAVRRGGGVVSSLADANAIVWTDHGPDMATADLFHGGVEWVQLEAAGIDRWIASGLVDRRRVWSSARGRYGAAVAEHVILLLLAACRRVTELARTHSWISPESELLAGKSVGIIGAGSIGRETIARLIPFGVTTLAVDPSPASDCGADHVFELSELDDVIERSDLVVLSVPLTPATRHLMNRERLALVGSRGWIVNVCRGPVVDTDALVEALRDGRLGGACLDVTDPEPLPSDHVLWDMSNVLITGHTANIGRMMMDSYLALIEDNVRLFATGEPVQGVIDLDRGY